MKRLSFYFDFLSPFSFLAWRELPKLQGVEIDYYPVPLGPLLNHWGIKGPGEVTPKREFLLKSLLRLTAREGIAFTTPKTHPFNSLYSLRLALKAVAGEHQPAVIAALWEAGWVKRIDMGEPEELLSALRERGLPADELYEKSFSKEARQGLKENLAQAIGLGVFGVPSFVVDGELFWGHDSLADLRSFLAGTDPLDRDKLTMLMNSTPRAATQSL